MTKRNDWFGLDPKTLEEMIAQGNETASMLLASQTGSGTTKPLDFEPTIALLEDAAKSDALAAYFLARILLKRGNSEKSLSVCRPVDLLKTDSHNHIARASTLLALLFEDGIGCEKNTELARQYLELGAAQGDATAWGLLGLQYVSELGEISEPETATNYFSKAVAGGHLASISYLARIYLEGGEVGKIE